MRVEPSSAKRQILDELLSESMVLVTLDARREGVVVPLSLRGDPQLRLNLSFRFGLPMETDDWGVRATLTFGGVPFECALPWSSVYMLVSHATGEPVLFPDDIPDESTQPASRGAPSPQLTVVATDGPTQDTPTPEPSPAQPQLPEGESGDDAGPGGPGQGQPVFRPDTAYNARKMDPYSIRFAERRT